MLVVEEGGNLAEELTHFCGVRPNTFIPFVQVFKERNSLCFYIKLWDEEVHKVCGDNLIEKSCGDVTTTVEVFPIKTFEGFRVIISIVVFVVG